MKLFEAGRRLSQTVRESAEGDGLVERALDRAPWLVAAGPKPIASVRAPLPGLPAARRPLVSVIIPCYNYGAFLPASSASALTQRGVEVEVIVVDDASTDDSAEVARSLAATDPRVRVIRHEKNAGHVVTFNDGYAQASGEFIVRLDADDLLTDGSLARAVALFDEFPNVGLVYGHPRHFTSKLPPAMRTREIGWTVWSGSDWIAERCNRVVNCITTPEAIARADVMKRVGPLDTRLRYAQDMEMWLRLAAVSDVGHVDGPDQAFHRDHAASMSAMAGSEVLTDLVERRTVFDVLFAGPGASIPGARRLQETAHKALAQEALERCTRLLVRGDDTLEDALISYAQQTDPRYADLPAWRTLNRCRQLGARRNVFMPVYLGGVAVRRVVEEVRHLRWIRSGT